MTSFSAKDVRLFHLNMLEVTYAPKDIQTMALEVTPDNIGSLSLEFETDLFYYENGMPFFKISVTRGTELDTKPNLLLHVRIGDWIVILWDEIHIFRTHEFNSTFDIMTPLEKMTTEQHRRNLGFNESDNARYVVEAGTLEEEAPEFKPSPVPRSEPSSFLGEHH